MRGSLFACCSIQVENNGRLWRIQICFGRNAYPPLPEWKNSVAKRKGKNLTEGWERILIVLSGCNGGARQTDRLQVEARSHCGLVYNWRICKHISLRRLWPPRHNGVLHPSPLSPQTDPRERAATLSVRYAQHVSRSTLQYCACNRRAIAFPCCRIVA